MSWLAPTVTDQVFENRILLKNYHIFILIQTYKCINVNLRPWCLSVNDNFLLITIWYLQVNYFYNMLVLKQWLHRSFNRYRKPITCDVTYRPRWNRRVINVITLITDRNTNFVKVHYWRSFNLNTFLTRLHFGGP